MPEEVGTPRRKPPRQAAVITGGAGFIGSNLAFRLLETGEPVIILDDLSRPGTERNVQWLLNRFGRRVYLELADIRDSEAVERATRTASCVFHLAAQVAVTTSLQAPVGDFEVNARSTLLLLEALRKRSEPPPILFTSTNKVYGALQHLDLDQNPTRYYPMDEAIRLKGVSEAANLEFCSPYGCSKGTADQYVLDYARTYGIPAVVFRMSCIYGPRQFGTEEQGWVAHFTRSALRDQTIRICGTGKQVRDVLYIDDLVDAFLLAMDNIDRISGEAFNIGGGPARTLSLLELIDQLRSILGCPIPTETVDWRRGDQKYYVSDTRKFRTATGWQPRITVREGLLSLAEWLGQLDTSYRRGDATGHQPSQHYME